MTEDRIALVARLVEAVLAEAGRRDPGDAIAWPEVPDVRAMTAHVGGVQRWTSGILRTGAPGPVPAAPAGDLAAWAAEAGGELLRALRATPADRPVWVLGGTDRTAAFWRRRMVFEHAKHLSDLRAAGGGPWRAVDELTAGDCADGIDEVLDVFLPRARPALAPLPGPVVLAAVDLDRTWRVAPDWTADGGAGAGAGTRVTARAADLLLLLWERADPVADPLGRFRLEGGSAAAEALRAARLNPW